MIDVTGPTPEAHVQITAEGVLTLASFDAHGAARRILDALDRMPRETTVVLDVRGVVRIEPEALGIAFYLGRRLFARPGTSVIVVGLSPALTDAAAPYATRVGAGSHVIFRALPDAAAGDPAGAASLDAGGLPDLLGPSVQGSA